MAEFIWKVKDENGQTIVRQVTSYSEEESRKILLSQGFTDLQLVSDEIMTRAINGRKMPILPKDFISNFGKPQPTFLNTFWNGILQFKKYYILFSLCAITTFYITHDYAVAIVAIAIMLFWPFFWCWIRLSSIYYARLNKAKDWHRWKQVLNYTYKLEKLCKSHPVKLPLREIIRNRSQALAGIGKIEDALKEHEKYKNFTEVTDWLANSHLASIYDIIKDYDKSIEYTWAVLKEKQTPVYYIEQADRLLRYKKDSINSKVLLDKIDTGLLTEIAKPYYHRCRGILAYLNNEISTAKNELNISLEIMERTRKQVFRDSNISIVKGYLCCVYAKMGDLSNAKKCFNSAKHYLYEANETLLFDECTKLLGL
jgi:tetratricopeptide (TPR) repeat protein